MELHLLDSSWDVVHVLDSFEEMIWVDRYWDEGEFKVRTLPSSGILTALNTARYARFNLSEHIMVIEDIEIERSPEEMTAMLIIQGRSLESILDRRIVWDRTYMDGLVFTTLNQVFDDNIISPTDTSRQIQNFSLETPTDPSILGMSINTQYHGDTILKVVKEICRAKEIGFKCILTSTGNIEMYLYNGIDRSYNQTENPYVVFSPGFDNLQNATYIESSRLEKTIVLIAGEEGVGNQRFLTTFEAPGGALSGLERKETYFEPSVQRNIGSTEMSDEDYTLHLQGRGKEELAKQTRIYVFDGETDTSTYVYGLSGDFYMGDIVQVGDEFGHERELRVTEMIYSHDGSGEKIYPAFTTKSKAHNLNGQSIKTGIPTISAPTLTSA